MTDHSRKRLNFASSGLLTAEDFSLGVREVDGDLKLLDGLEVGHAASADDAPLPNNGDAVAKLFHLA